MCRTSSTVCLLICLFLTPVPAALATEPFHYPEARHGKGELKYVNDLPVLLVEGTPRKSGIRSVCSA